MSDPRVRIMDLRDAAGFWEATIHVNGLTREVDRRYGSWMQIVPVSGVVNGEVVTVNVRREVPRWIASALADRVRPLDKKRKAQEAVAA